MEFEIIKWGAYALAGILGWFVRVLWTAQEEMRKDMNALERELPLAYVRRDEFKEVIKEVKDSFKEAINPVLRKLDRMEERMQDQEKEFERTFIRKPE